MTKEECWRLFKKTGKIEYYLAYKQLEREEMVHDKEN